MDMGEELISAVTKYKEEEVPVHLIYSMICAKYFNNDNLPRKTAMERAKHTVDTVLRNIEDVRQ